MANDMGATDPSVTEPVPLVGRATRFGLECAGWSYLALTGLVCADVVGRRVLGLSTAATTEIGGYLLAIGIAWGLAGTLVERAHIRIDVFVLKAPSKVRAWLHAFALSVLSAAALFALYGSLQVTIDSWRLGATDLTPLRVPLALPQGLWSLGLAGFALVALVLLVAVMRAVLSGVPERADAICAPKTYQDEATETLDALGRTRPADWRSSSEREPCDPTGGDSAPGRREAGR
ncbi:MAG: hypothetical protein RJA99_3900 [Pseudomonadota bacterium]|jgi:TRAP-type C4-dicarboxylate transport system permease small subunit